MVLRLRATMRDGFALMTLCHMQASQILHATSSRLFEENETLSMLYLWVLRDSLLFTNGLTPLKQK
jgi:hypothetical protein